MSATFKPYIPPKRHNEPLSEREIERELEQERLFHRLHLRKSVAMCQCGYSFIDPQKTTIHWRHNSHVKCALKHFENNLRGIHEDID